MGSEDSRLSKLLDKGYEIASAQMGGAFGGIAGWILGGLPGAVIGGASAPLVEQVFRMIGGAGREVSRRELAPREEQRVGAVLLYTAAQIKSHLDSGGSIRGDGFFLPDATGRSKADEIAEAVLQSAQRDPEEQKLPYMGNIIVNLAIYPILDANEAHHLIRVSNDLTYRQLCVLGIAGGLERGTKAYPLRSVAYRDRSVPVNVTQEIGILLHEIYQLYNSFELINFGQVAVLGWGGITPAKMKIEGFGSDLYNHMNLERLPNSDLDVIAARLK
jgi:hypothetical protein